MIMNYEHSSVSANAYTDYIKMLGINNMNALFFNDLRIDDKWLSARLQ